MTRPGSSIWERTDKPFCSFKYVTSTKGYYETAGRGNETLSILEEDLKTGSGAYLIPDDESHEFEVEKVVQIPDGDIPIRVLSPGRPPFGEWKVVDPA